MRDKDDESRIKEYMAKKMRHIKMYNACMNLADGLDVEQFAELVRQDEREAVLEAVEALTGMEADRHKMFSEGYDHALYHIRQVVEGRSKARGEK